MKFTVEEIRGLVSDTLARMGHSNTIYLDDLRKGHFDESPFMIGAFAVNGELARREREGEI